MKLFLGEYDHALDDRSRVTIPRRIRSEIGQREVVLARGFEPCIFGFDTESWQTEAAKHLEAPVTDEKARNIRRYLFSGAQKTEVDKLGRILLPTQLKEYAGIAGEVVFIGAGDHFEIWDKSAWVKHAKSLNGV